MSSTRSRSPFRYWTVRVLRSLTSLMIAPSANGSRWPAEFTRHEYGLRVKTIFSPGTYCTHLKGPEPITVSGLSQFIALLNAGWSPFTDSAHTCLGRIDTFAAWTMKSASTAWQWKTTVYGSGASTSG